jgi:hypothetical protein
VDTTHPVVGERYASVPGSVVERSDPTDAEALVRYHVIAAN